MVDITFRTAGAWGAGQGSNLTAAQVDTNFFNLKDALEGLLGDIPAGVSISNVTVTGSQMTVWLEDGSSFGPFTLPVANWAWRGEWTADTGYFAFDVFRVGLTGVYLVLQDHVSASEFDPAEENTEGALYEEILGSVASITAPIVTVGVDFYSPSLTEAGSYFRCVHPDGCDFQMPDNAQVAFPVGTELHLYQGASNPVIINTDTGVTINPYDGFLEQTGGRGRVVTLKKVGSDTWDIFGGLAEDTTA